MLSPFHEKFADTLRDFGFSPTFADSGSVMLVTNTNMFAPGLMICWLL